jgi:hypothetical protein
MLATFIHFSQPCKYFVIVLEVVVEIAIEGVVVAIAVAEAGVVVEVEGVVE